MTQASELKGLNACFTSGLLTATGAETVYDTTVTIVFAINGKLYTKTAITDGATPTTDGNTGAAFSTLAASRGCALLWCLNSSGTVSLRQGPVERLDGANAFINAPQFPSYPDSVTPFAYSILKNGSTGSTFTIGSSNWNATGMTATHVNIATVPSRPQES
jgi:hypothetical protein